MNRKMLISGLVLVSLIILTIRLKSVAQSQVNPPPPLPFSALSVEIAVPSQSVLSLQPIPINLKLTNNNSRPALGYKVIGFEGCPMYLYVKKVGTNLRVPISMLQTIHEFVKYTNVPLEPRESIESKDLITLGLARYFPEPGSYEIQARLANSNYTEFIESNIVTINVQEPTVVNLGAYNLIRNSSFQEFLFSGAEFGDVKNTLETLTTLYPNSPYARNASFVLGENYFYSRNYPQALINLVRLENDNDFVYADKITKYLAEIRRVNSLQPEKPEPKMPQ